MPRPYQPPYDIHHWNTPNFEPVFHRAASSNRVTLFGVTSPEEIVRLIREGADPNERDGEGRTPIFYARTVAIAKALLAGGASLDVRDARGKTPIFVTPGGSDVIDFLCDGGCEPDAQDDHGDTLAHLTVDPKVIATLLGQGADFTLRNAAGQDPLETQSARRDALDDIVDDDPLPVGRGVVDDQPIAPPVRIAFDVGGGAASNQRNLNPQSQGGSGAGQNGKQRERDDAARIVEMIAEIVDTIGAIMQCVVAMI
ncbi:MAG TPA: ankyrin repeat domain-containing protein [Acetobacteraceae bacterium]|nr:ankyrin repeat domain-containing protein [Acetobacteraceae bacterium]